MKKSRIIIIVLAVLCVIGSFGRKREPKPQPETVEATMGERTVTIRDWTPEDEPIDQEAIDRALAEFPDPTPPTKNVDSTKTYILNTNTNVFHLSGCADADRIKDSNRKTATDSRDRIISQNYKPCSKCNP